MHPLPHQYSVTVQGQPQGNLLAYGPNTPPMNVAPPAQFDGPGDQWTPEELLMAALANCFTLSFRVIAGIAKLEWSDIDVSAQGTLDKVERKIKFTEVTTTARLVIANAADKEKAEQALQKAEASCFVSNSLNCPVHLHTEIVVAGA